MGNQICGEHCSCAEIEASEIYEAVKTAPNENTDPLKKSLNTKSKLSNTLSRKEIPILSPEIQQIIETRHHFSMPFQENNFPKRRFGSEIYQGQLNNNGQPHGLGRMFKSDGSLFVGYFQDGKAEGNGLFIFKDGSYFQGKISGNMAHCLKGKYFSKDLKYQGEFKSNTFDGEGREQSDTHIFTGTYVNGKRTYGELKWWSKANTQQIYCFYGKFDQNQQFTDEGVLQQPTGKYTGNFSKGKKHGFGVYEYISKLKYQGEYKQGSKHGKGKISFSSDGNLIYSGGWKNNMPQGQGFKFSEQGEKIRVFYKDGINVLNLKDQNIK